MRIYVATKFENRERARDVMDALRAAGHEIVGDWTAHTTVGLTGRTLIDRLQEYASADLAAVAESDATVLLPVPAERTRSGAHLVEFGYALGRDKLVAVLGGRPGAPTEHPIFFFDPRVHHFDTVEALVRFLRWAEDNAEAQ